MSVEQMVFADGKEMAAHVARWMADRIAASNERFRIALSGGNTPRALYAALASDDYFGLIDWDRIVLFWGDERFVPASNSESNFRMVHEVLLSHVPIPAQNIKPIPTDGSPEDAAKRYEAELKQDYGSDALDPADPLFDLVLLGLGDDGHLCSLFPGSPVLEERSHWVSAVTGSRPEPRITLTYPAIESCRAAAFLVTGADKAQALARVRSGDMALPASRLKPQGPLFWFLDRAAAGG